MLQFLVVAAVAGVALGAGCAQGPVRGGEGGLAGTAWQLVSLRGAPVPADAWIGFETATRARGLAGCNHFGAAYSQDGDLLRIEPIEMTEMACAGLVMEQEAAFVDALLDTRRASFSGRRLALLDDAGLVTASFERRAR